MKFRSTPFQKRHIRDNALNEVYNLAPLLLSARALEIGAPADGRRIFSFLKRPKYLDEPASNFTQIFSEFMRQIPADIYIYAHATAPFIECATVRECLDRVLSGEFDSAFCATKIQDFLWQDGTPLNFDADSSK